MIGRPEVPIPKLKIDPKLSSSSCRIDVDLERVSSLLAENGMPEKSIRTLTIFFKEKGNEEDAGVYNPWLRKATVLTNISEVFWHERDVNDTLLHELKHALDKTRLDTGINFFSGVALFLSIYGSTFTMVNNIARSLNFDPTMTSFANLAGVASGIIFGILAEKFYLEGSSLERRAYKFPQEQMSKPGWKPIVKICEKT